MLRRALIRSRALPSFNLLLFGLLMSAGLRAQGEIHGQVLNETLHRPVANLEVRLLSPKGGMQEVPPAMTDRDERGPGHGDGSDEHAASADRRGRKETRRIFYSISDQARHDDGLRGLRGGLHAGGARARRASRFPD